MKYPLLWVTLLYVLTAKGHIEVIDTEYSLRTAHSIIEEGSLSIKPVDSNLESSGDNASVSDKFYSQYGIGILAIFVPVVGISKIISSLSGIEETLLTHFILSFYNIPFAILGLYYFRNILQSLGQNSEVSNFFMICLGFGTIFWKYVVTDFSEVTQISLLLGAINFYLQKYNNNKWFYISFHLSFLVLLKLVYIVIIPPFIVLAIIEGKTIRLIYKYLVQGATFLIPSSLLLMFANHARFGSIFETGYGNAQSAFSFSYFMRDWSDYIISFDRGILPYSPIILAAIIVTPIFYKKNKSALFLISYIVITLYILMSSWIGWKGGYCWGNRNLVPIVPVICILWSFIEWKNLYHRQVFLMLLCISIPVQIIAISLKTHEWSVLSFEFSDHPDPFYKPNELIGSVLLFKEKLTNSSGIYNANYFVPEHSHQINLANYDSFYGFNYWFVHASKMFTPSWVGFIGNLTLLIVILLLVFVFYKFYPKSSTIN